MKKVLLLCGGRSTEHYISCLSAITIIENIDKQKYELTTVIIDESNRFYVFNDDMSYLKNGTWRESENIHLISNIITYLSKFDVIFPITHGNNGEDGKLQGFLDLFDIKYVGSKTLASALGMDKRMAKIIFNHLEIPQVPYVTFTYPNYSIKEIKKQLNYPVIVKPANGGSSIGITKANNKKELTKAIEVASNYDDVIIVEKFIKAKELECSIIEHKKLIASTIGEIIPANEFYDYNAKYENDTSQTIIPAKLQKNISSLIKEYAKKAFLGIGASGFSRVDFFYDEKNNQVYLNEINTIPGFTTISMFPQLLMFDTISLTEIISILIENELKR